VTDTGAPIQTQSTIPVNDLLPWVIATMPLLGWAADAALDTDLWPVYIGANVGLCALDVGQLKKAGYHLDLGWIFLIPVYLWKRASLVHHPRTTAWVWLVGLVATLAVPALTQSTDDRELACQLVTQILHEQDTSAPSCKGITILQDPGTGFVKASALLSDGSERAITIEHRGDSVEVQLLPR